MDGDSMTTKHTTIGAMNIYQGWMKFLSKAKCAYKGRPDGKHGRISMIGSTVFFTYWNTHIVIIQSSGTIWINNSGYNTKSTKDRINRIISPLGYLIVQRKFKWYLSREDEDVLQPLDDTFCIALQPQPIYKPTKMKGSEEQ